MCGVGSVDKLNCDESCLIILALHILTTGNTVCMWVTVGFGLVSCRPSRWVAFPMDGCFGALGHIYLESRSIKCQLNLLLPPTWSSIYLSAGPTILLLLLNERSFHIIISVMYIALALQTCLSLCSLALAAPSRGTQCASVTIDPDAAALADTLFQTNLIVDTVSCDNEKVPMIEQSVKDAYLLAGRAQNINRNDEA